MRILWTALMMIPLAAYAETVPVLTQPVAAGESFSGLVEMKEVEDGRVFAGTVKEMVELDGMVAGRALRAGVPVQRTQIKPDYPVKRSSLVTMTYKRGVVQLSGRATALDDAGMGEQVRILNPETRATLVAVVVGDGRVEVR